MGKLRKGDYVMALPETDGRYHITCHANDYRGYIIKVKREGTVVVATEPDASDGFIVDPRYFKQINEQDPERDLPSPDADLFAALF